MGFGKQNRQEEEPTDWGATGWLRPSMFHLLAPNSQTTRVGANTGCLRVGCKEVEHRWSQPTRGTPIGWLFFLPVLLAKSHCFSSPDSPQGPLGPAAPRARV